MTRTAKNSKKKYTYLTKAIQWVFFAEVRGCLFNRSGSYHDGFLLCSLGHGDGATHSKGHISNKTLYIALNYQEQTDRANAEVREEVVDRLIALEREQERLAYYIALLKDVLLLVIIILTYGLGSCISSR